MTGLWARHPVAMKIVAGGVTMFLIAKGFGR